jgi:hypothetical protein
VSLKATAGLRLLPGDKADRILEAVEKLLRSYPFKLADGAVAIMDGAPPCPSLYVNAHVHLEAVLASNALCMMAY